MSMEGEDSLLCYGCFESKLEEGICLSCGFKDWGSGDPFCLPLRTRLKNHYLIGRPLDVADHYERHYLAWDTETQQKLVIREFFPQSLVRRGADGLTVVPVSTDRGGLFEHGRAEFLSMYRAMRSLSHPNIRPIQTVFTANETAYVAQTYHQFSSMDAVLRSNLGAMSESLAASLCLAAADALVAAHELGLYHLNVRPKTILVGPGGKVFLTEFGLARYQMSERSHDIRFTRDEFTAPELHGAIHETPRQTADIYSLCATFFQALTGEAPRFGVAEGEEHPASYKLGRRAGDLVVEGCRPNPATRIQTMAEVRDRLAELARVVSQSGNAPDWEQLLSPASNPVATQEPIQTGSKRGSMRQLTMPYVMAGLGFVLFCIGIIRYPSWPFLITGSLMCGGSLFLTRHWARGSAGAGNPLVQSVSDELQKRYENGRIGAATSGKSVHIGKVTGLFKSALKRGNLLEAQFILGKLAQAGANIVPLRKALQKASRPGSKITGPMGIQMILIPAGTFTMGSKDGDEEEQPVHQVTLSKPYYMSIYPVTQKQWVKLMGSKPWHGKPHAQDLSSAPATYISWHDADRYVRKINEKTGESCFRLPTEAEWEYAARGGSQKEQFIVGGGANLDEYAWFHTNTTAQKEPWPHKVGKKKENPYGLYDVLGNVWEWCRDGYYDYRGISITDPRGGEGFSERMCRGGGYNNTTWLCRVTTRGIDDPKDSLPDHGFRLLKEI